MSIRDFDAPSPSDPKDWPTLPCPECDNTSLKCYGAVVCDVIDCPGPAVRVIGNMSYGITVPIQLKDDPDVMCFCNKSGCQWVGTIEEAKNAYSPGWKERYDAIPYS